MEIVRKEGRKKETKGYRTTNQTICCSRCARDSTRNDYSCCCSLTLCGLLWIRFCRLYLSCPLPRVTSSSGSWPIKWESNNSSTSSDYLWRNTTGNSSCLRWGWSTGNSFLLDKCFTGESWCWPAATWEAVNKIWAQIWTVLIWPVSEARCYFHKLIGGWRKLDCHCVTVVENAPAPFHSDGRTSAQPHTVCLFCWGHKAEWSHLEVCVYVRVCVCLCVWYVMCSVWLLFLQWQAESSL